MSEFLKIADNSFSFPMKTSITFRMLNMSQPFIHTATIRATRDYSQLEDPCQRHLLATIVASGSNCATFFYIF